MFRRIIVPALLALGLLTAAQSAAPTPAAHAAAPRLFISGAAVAARARSYVGYRYSLLGATPWTGFSCIGLVHWVYATLGIDVPDELHAAAGSAPWVNRWALQAGDVVFFQNTDWYGLSHAAIYIGHNLVVAADNFGVGVTVDNITDAYWASRYYGAVRPLAR